MRPAEYARMHAAEERQWWYAGMRRISLAVLDRLLPQGGLRLLDAGCGTGWNVRVLRRYGAVVGVDRAAEALALGRDRGVPLARADLACLPFAEGTFDAATVFDVLYHLWVKDDQAAVRELARVLRAGGLLLVRVPALGWLRGAHDEEVLTRHRYGRDELVRLLETCGFSIVRATYCNMLLLPLVAARRAIDRWSRRRGSDVEFLPRPVEAFFRALLALEACWLARWTLPIGSSLLVVARKQAGSGPGLDESMRASG
jgi:SAM-dependent methyltransferase